jgi:molybdopterin synthase sulfur carrier subunit
MTHSVKVQVRYFASLRETLGTGEVVAFDGDTTVGAVRAALVLRSPAHAQALAPDRAVRSALNQTLCDEAAGVSDGAELAFFPPVTGG